jgi:hypothetical protein
MAPPRPPDRRYVLEIGTTFAGVLLAAEGGDAYAEVINEAGDATGVVKKHLGPVHYSDLTLVFDTGMTDGFFKLVTDLLDRRVNRISGVVRTLDLDGREQVRTEFTKALVTEFSLPALDAASRERGQMMLRLVPEKTTRRPGSGQVLQIPVTPQTPWVISNFRLRIDGLDCTRVPQIERLSFFRPASGLLSVPDVVVAVSEASAADWRNWHEDFVIAGNNGPAQEKSGTLELLTPNLASALMTLSFAGIGIHRLQPVPATTGAIPPRVRAWLYCEKAARVLIA